ncbi:MAG: hypothetical protein AAFX99_27005, partial [Myxococcota bacterium]
MGNPDTHKSAWDRLRHHLHSSTPTAEDWHHLLELLKGWPGERTLALEYTQAHLDSWPAEVCTNPPLSLSPNDEGTWVWALVRHLKLGPHDAHFCTAPNAALRAHLTHPGSHIRHVTLSGRHNLEALLMWPPLHHISGLCLMDCFREGGCALDDDDWQRIDTHLPHLTALTLINSPNIHLDATYRLRHVKQLRLIAVEPDISNTVETIKLPIHLRSLEVSAQQLPPGPLLSTLKHSCVERLTLRHVALDAQSLEVLNACAQRCHLDLSDAVLDEEAIAWLQTAARSNVVGPTKQDAITCVIPHQDTKQVTMQLMQRLGKYTRDYFDEAFDSGEHQNIELWYTPNAGLRFNLYWSAYGLAGPGYPEEVDYYQLRGSVYPMTPDHLLLVPEHREGLHAQAAHVPYVRFIGDDTCSIMIPTPPNTSYDGPFGTTHKRPHCP